MPWLACLLLILMPLVARAEVNAQARAAAEAHDKQAAKFYEAGQWELARIEFEAAFKLTNEPDVLYNVAMCWEREGDVRQVIATLERYCQMKPDDKAAAQKLAKLRESVAAAQLPSAATPPSATPKPQTVPEPKSGEGKSPVLSTKRKVAIAFLAGGGAFLVGALGAGIAAELDRQSLQSGDLTYRDAQTTASRASTERAVAISFGVVGGALAVGGIPLLLIR